MVNLPPAGRHISAREEPNKRCVVHKLQEHDGLVTGGATVSVRGEKQGRKNTALGGSSADGLGFRDMFPQLHMLLLVRLEVCDPPAGGVWHLKEDSVERGHVYCIVYRTVGSVGELQWWWKSTGCPGKKLNQQTKQDKITCTNTPRQPSMAPSRILNIANWDTDSCSLSRSYYRLKRPGPCLNTWGGIN